MTQLESVKKSEVKVEKAGDAQLPPIDKMREAMQLAEKPFTPPANPGDPLPDNRQSGASR